MEHGVDFTKTPKSLKKIIGNWPTFIMIKKDLWDEAMKMIEAGQDDSGIDVTEEGDMMMYDNIDGKFVINHELKYTFTIPFGETQGYKGLYEWIADTYVKMKLGKVANFEEYIRDNPNPVDVVEIEKGEGGIVTNGFYIDC